jgi:hypothetical protein
MLLQVEGSFSEESWVILKAADAVVALDAEQKPDLAGSVVVIHAKLSAPTARPGAGCLGLAADSTQTRLSGVHGSVLANKQTFKGGSE